MNALIRHLVFEPVKTVYQDLRRMQMNRGRFLRISAIAGVLLFWSISALTAQVRHLKPAEAVHLAVEQNRTLKIARLKVQENEHRKEGARSAHFPTLTNQSNILHLTDLENVLIPPGAFGTLVGVPIPARNTALSLKSGVFPAPKV